ncbi:MAG: glucoamylase family protein [Gemmatimonadaceae bacterium]
MNRNEMDDDALIQLESDTFNYFLKETNRDNGLVPDSTRAGSTSSITAIGFALASYTAGVERRFITRADALERTLTTLRFLWHSPQGEARDVTGYKGFFYHFLDMQTGRRADASELSTIDTTFLLAGVLAAAAYFDRDTKAECEIRELADALYSRVDWNWALNGGSTVSHGWTPERGFLKARWDGYSEAILLYALGLGSPTHPLPDGSYDAWTRSYTWKNVHGHEFLYAGPLFIHQLSHVWIDFRGIQDGYMRERGIDYFENSRRATLAQQQYAIRNPKNFAGYGEFCWGITASDGPGPDVRRIDGVQRRFYDYVARGIPWGPDDGTIAPWAVVASLPFAPEIVLPTISSLSEAYPHAMSKYGLRCSFNETFRGTNQDMQAWHSQRYYGLDQGPVVLMIENYLSGFLWNLMKRCPPVVSGLRRAGFTNGWLEVISQDSSSGDMLHEDA